MQLSVGEYKGFRGHIVCGLVTVKHNRLLIVVNMKIIQKRRNHLRGEEGRNGPLVSTTPLPSIRLRFISQH